MKPIPKSLLIHTAEAITHGETDMWNEQTENCRTKISFVRLEPSSALKLNSQNEQIQLNAVLIFDCRNSRPRNFDFSSADRIEADGNQYRIVSIDKLYDGKKLHHLEVGLCL